MATLRQLCLALLLLAAASCHFTRSSEPAFSENGFSVRAASGHLILTNGSPAAIHYVALEEETSARVDLYFDPRAWPSIEPGAERRIPYGDLMGYHAGAKQARVYWWTAERYGKHIIVDLR